MKSVLNGLEAVYKAPKDWSPDGGLFWLTTLVVSAVVLTVFFRLSGLYEKGL